MKIFLDLLPIILFFVAYKFADIYVATGVVILATAAQVAWAWLRHRKVDNMLWASLILVVLLGGATLIWHDENFIKWKLTVLYWLFALVLLGASLFFRNNLVRKLLEKQLEAALPESVWALLNGIWIGFFALMGGLNLFIARNFSTDVWVDFKLFGTFGLMVVFFAVQAAILYKYLKEEQ